MSSSLGVCSPRAFQPGLHGAPQGSTGFVCRGARHDGGNQSVTCTLLHREAQAGKKPGCTHSHGAHGQLGVSQCPLHGTAEKCCTVDTQQSWHRYQPWSPEALCVLAAASQLASPQHWCHKDVDAATQRALQPPKSPGLWHGEESIASIHLQPGRSQGAVQGVAGFLELSRG
ncbi:hypothetical protein P7K49_026001 [Saguinus oedipus]|uniref:Uncharacterized protein n=1 Tax=Saguinus oedipus TaxID=9490 RepID=A0ABQ9UL54_SAGOE|nr:hypothetical protein P7K49_026001 [Saguinus oedipus]